MNTTLTATLNDDAKILDTVVSEITPAAEAPPAAPAAEAPPAAPAAEAPPAAPAARAARVSRFFGRVSRFFGRVYRRVAPQEITSIKQAVFYIRIANAICAAVLVGCAIAAYYEYKAQTAPWYVKVWTAITG